MFLKKILFLFVILITGFVFGIIVQKRCGSELFFFSFLKSFFIKTSSVQSPLFVDNISIDISQRDYEQLMKWKEKALAKKVISPAEKKFVPAKIRFLDSVIDAEIRLKGDWPDHLETGKISFRVKLKGKHVLFGMKTFSLQHPITRNYIYEWIFHQALKRENIIALRYKFVNVNINKQNMGIYALEEHFDKLLPEHNKKREGVILKLNEDIAWEERVHFFSNVPAPVNFSSNPSGLQSEISANTDAFGMKKTLTDTVLYKQFLAAESMLEKFREHKAETHEVFDVKKIALYFALSELLGAEHAALWHNLRFYYNPIISKLEPVGFDGNAGFETQHITGIFFDDNSGTDFYRHLLSDTVFFTEYVHALRKVSEKSYLDSLLYVLDGELNKNTAVLKNEFKEFTYSASVFYKNRSIISTYINPGKAIHGYINKAGNGKTEIEIGNIQALPVKIISVSVDSVYYFPKHIIELNGKNPYERVQYSTYDFYFPAGFTWNGNMKPNLKIQYTSAGNDTIKEEKAFPFPRVAPAYSENEKEVEKGNLWKFSFMKTDKKNKIIYIKQGSWNVENILIIPSGYTVTASSNTRIILNKAAKIISYSPLQFTGSEDDPVIIQAVGKGKGITILQAGKKSFLKHVYFYNLSNPVQNNGQITGAVTFYESPVEIYKCRFINNTGEDALNIIQSKFSISSSLFMNTSSDALDIDFSDGVITGSEFINCGNDAIDVSGSNVKITDIFIRSTGDKGISAGENSYVTLQKTIIGKANTAVACKDLSEIKADGIFIDSCKTGYAVFQKKPEYGHASVNAVNSFIKNTSSMYQVEKNSILQINGKTIRHYTDCKTEKCL